jgi:hypothetical protein
MKGSDKRPALKISRWLVVCIVLVVPFASCNLAPRTVQPTLLPPTIFLLPTSTMLASITVAAIPPRATNTLSPSPTQSVTQTLHSITETVFSCRGAPPPRIHIDDLTRVTYTDGRSLRIRSSPEVLSNNIITQAPEGTVNIKIIGGPVCSELPGSSRSYIFWQVRLKDHNIEGWTAEGDAENYYLEIWP